AGRRSSPGRCRRNDRSRGTGTRRWAWPGKCSCPPSLDSAAMTIRTAVIPAAGLGTRFLPATKAQPKGLLPIVDTPAIQLVVEEALASGLDDVIVVLGPGQDALRAHFARDAGLEEELEARGKADALAAVRRATRPE